MKKLSYLFTLLLSLSVVVTSCKNNEKHEAEHETESSLAAEKADLAMNDVYQCPMGCEEGKTYDKEGSCPVCKMDLKKVEKEDDHEHENDEGHDKEGQDND